jgi:hypothetical protein
MAGRVEPEREHRTRIPRAGDGTADDGKRPQLAFAVHHLVDMLRDLKKHYDAAYQGEVEP